MWGLIWQNACRGQKTTLRSLLSLFNFIWTFGIKLKLLGLNSLFYRSLNGLFFIFIFILYIRSILTTVSPTSSYSLDPPQCSHHSLPLFSRSTPIMDVGSPAPRSALGHRGWRERGKEKADLPEISTEHSITSYNKSRKRPSYQGLTISVRNYKCKATPVEGKSSHKQAIKSEIPLLQLLRFQQKSQAKVQQRVCRRSISDPFSIHDCLFSLCGSLRTLFS